MPPPPGQRQQASAQPGARPPGAPPSKTGRRQPPTQGTRRQQQGRPGATPPVVAGREEREPELITHRAYNGTAGDGGYETRWADEEELRSRESGFDDEDEPSGRKGKAPLTPAQRRKRRWKIIRRSLYACVGLFLVLPAAAFAITYFLVEVPSPEEVAADQAKVVTYYYADGKTEMGRDIPPDGGNRQILQPDDITAVVRHAVYAAEDATFETNAGFDVTGIMRAVWNQVTGGVGGGSTISQQYIKVATENDEYSITRKWTELVKAFKMNNEQSKDEIITAYLNTIYFGRGAYGIQTAAQAYYGKDAKDLDASEAALLAGMIQQPGRADKPKVREQRWNYVMDQMVANGWLRQQDRDAAKVPELIPEEQGKPETITGSDAYVKYRIKAELEAKGYPEEKVQAGGYKIYTTIDPRAQDLAKKAVNKVMKGEPQKLREALVAVDPETGAVRAYYGGPNEPGVDQYDWGNAQRNPGSAYKPFDFVALLQRGKGLGEVYDGSSPRRFGNRDVRNSDDAQCPRCTVAEAMERSINTVFYDIVVNEVGPQAVAEAAMQAGIPEKGPSRETMPNPDGNISIGGGKVEVTPTQMAGAYATFASGGIRHETHFVAKLTTSDGEVLFDETSEAATEGEPAFSDDPEKSKQIAGNVTESLKPVLPYSDLECAGGRECAGKTGTHQYVDPSGETVNENAQAWMVGYTPQISAAVWVGTGGNEPIRNAAGGRIYGSGLPGEIWQEFMNTYLEGMPEVEFEEVEPIGKVPTEVVDDSSSTTTPPTTTPPTTTTESTPPHPTGPPTDTETDTETNTSSSETQRPTGILPGWGRNTATDTPDE